MRCRWPRHTNALGEEGSGEAGEGCAAARLAQTQERGSMRVIEASTHCVGLFLAQPAEQEFGSPSQNLFASVSAHRGEDQHHHPARVQQRPAARSGTCSPWLQLLSGAHRVPLLCSVLPLGTVSPPPKAWSCEHVDAHGHGMGTEQRRGRGWTSGDEGFIWEKH